MVAVVAEVVVLLLVVVDVDGVGDGCADGGSNCFDVGLGAVEVDARELLRFCFSFLLCFLDLPPTFGDGAGGGSGV